MSSYNDMGHLLSFYERRTLEESCIRLGLFFFKFWIEFTSKAFRAWSLLYGEAFNWRFCFF